VKHEKEVAKGRAYIAKQKAEMEQHRKDREARVAAHAAALERKREAKQARKKQRRDQGKWW
jgi:hypothetical protein